MNEVFVSILQPIQEKLDQLLNAQSERWKQPDLERHNPSSDREKAPERALQYHTALRHGTTMTPDNFMMLRALAVGTGLIRTLFSKSIKSKKRKGTIFEKAVGISYRVGAADGKRKNE